MNEEVETQGKVDASESRYRMFCDQMFMLKNIRRANLLNEEEYEAVRKKIINKYKEFRIYTP